MTGGEIAALIAAVAFVALVMLLAVPILRSRHTVDAATRALTDLTDRTGPLISNVNTTIDNVNVALTQAHTSLNEVNVQLERLDTITGHAAQVTANVANLTTVVTAAAASPMVKVAAMGYGVRRAVAKRRREDEEHEMRDAMKGRRKAERAARRGK